MATLHQKRTHPEPVDDCFACRVSTIMVDPKATPTREKHVGAKNQRDIDERSAERSEKMRKSGKKPVRI